MTRIIHKNFGEPEAVLTLENQPKPIINEGEILVKLTVRPIHPSDLLTIRGLYGSLPNLPAVPGNEGTGIIESIGSKVQGLKPGQRVIPAGIPGTWQDYIIAKPEQLIPIPDEISDANAAQFTVNPLTALVMISEELKVEPGQWLMQTAASSTLGQVVIQLSTLMDFKTINVVRREDQVKPLKEAGAAEVICIENQNILERVNEITEGKGVPAIIDAVGGQTGAECIRSLSRHGTMLCYGLLSGEPIPLDVGYMIFRSSAVRGFWLSDWFRRSPVENRLAVSAKLLEYMAKGEITPPVAAEYPLADVIKAVEHAERKGRQGKVLLVG